MATSALTGTLDVMTSSTDIMTSSADTSAGSAGAATDFLRDLNRLDREIAGLAGAGLAGVGLAGAGADRAASQHDTIRLVSLQYRRATLLGSWDALRLVSASLDGLVGRLGALPDLCLLQGMLALTMHRL